MSGPDSLWRQRLIAYLHREANPPHKYGHQPRLYALTQQIAVASSDLIYDDDVVFAAAFLHDLGVFIGHRPEDPAVLAHWNHVTYTCEKALSLLQDIGFPAAKIPAMLDCIREHQPQDDPQSPEATLLRDADMLEQLGAIAIFRTAAKLGSDTRFLHFADAQRSLQQALVTLPGKLRLPAAREIAKPRIATLSSFLSALEAEANDHLG